MRLLVVKFIEPIGYVIRGQSFEHQSEPTKIGFCRGISQNPIKVFDEDFTSPIPSI